MNGNSTSDDDLARKVQMQQFQLDEIARETAGYRYRSAYLVGVLLLILGMVTPAVSVDHGTRGGGESTFTFLGLSSIERTDVTLDYLTNSASVIVWVIAILTVALIAAAAQQVNDISWRGSAVLIAAVILALTCCVYIFLVFAEKKGLGSGVAPYLVIGGASAMGRAVTFPSRTR